MGINIRTKGATAEREVADALNTVLNMVRIEHGGKVPAKPTVQRNQNQTAVGGCDLINTFHFAIEVKRQEALSINTWWKQCVISAQEISGAVPVLIYRQSKQPWKVILPAWLPSYCNEHVQARAEISFDDFQRLFRAVATDKIKVGEFE